MATPQVLAPNGTGSIAPRTAITGFGVEFRPFLHAQLWEEENGMHLSILSALARLDLDPWEEAATLAQLPTEAASQRLSALLRALPGAPATTNADEPVYHRALDLLPVSKGPSPIETSGAIANAKSQARWRLVINLAFIASMFASLAIMAGETSRGSADNTQSTPPAAASPKFPASSSK